MYHGPWHTPIPAFPRKRGKVQSAPGQEPSPARGGGLGGGSRHRWHRTLPHQSSLRKGDAGNPPVPTRLASTGASLQA